MRKAARVIQRMVVLLLLLDLLVGASRYWASDDGESRYLAFWGAVLLGLLLSAVYAVCFVALLAGDLRAERRINRGASEES